MVVRLHTWHHALIGAATCAVALSGCGSAAVPGSGAPPASGASGQAASGQAKVSLTVTVINGPGTAPSHWTLRCDPPGGSHPNPAAICRALLHMRTTVPFAERPKRMMCPMIMISNRRIIVSGTWFGTQVRHRVIIDGGCDVGLFGAMDKLLR